MRKRLNDKQKSLLLEEIKSNSEIIEVKPDDGFECKYILKTKFYINKKLKYGAGKVWINNEAEKERICKTIYSLAIKRWVK